MRDLRDWTTVAVLLAFGLAIAVFTAPAHAADSGGTITISVKEYERLKKIEEGADEGHYWSMTFQQILEKERGNRARAWELYEYYVLRRLHLSGPVTGASVVPVIESIHVLNEISDKPITLVLSSPGGSVLDGLALYNAMMTSEAPIHTVCDGWAMSMAAVLLAAGDHRTARDGCIFMLHEVAAGAPGGQTTDHIKWADSIISVENVLLQILSENSGLSRADVRRLWEYETWWSPDEALALGFVDEVEGNKPRALAAGTRAIPEALLPSTRITRHISERMQ